MPKYTKKITRAMDYKEFAEAIEDLPQQKQAFLSVLFFAGCRVSEALALHSSDITCTPELIYVQFYRLKGSKQTDPVQIPRVPCLVWLCSHKGILFPFSRTTAWRIVKRVFPDMYPHYFRHNRITHIAEQFSVATILSFTGISITSLQHYVQKVDIKRVGKALREEIS